MLLYSQRLSRDKSLTVMSVATSGYEIMCASSCASEVRKPLAVALKLRTNSPSTSPCSTLFRGVSANESILKTAKSKRDELLLPVVVLEDHEQ